jgi:doublecortin-like kinase 1/2
VLDKENPITNLYKFGEMLGQGSFASVYACTSLSDSTLKAIKVIKRSRVRGKEHEHMLEMEIEIMFQIKRLL